MNRRAFLLGSLAVATPFAAEAQRTAKMHRIGVLWLQPRSGVFESFIRALAELGYVEGQNLEIDFRQVTSAELPALAADLVRRNVAVIVAQATRATRAAMEATRTIPIVMVGAADPVATGLVSSLHHPGGNVTGSTDMRPALTAKRVELLKEIAPFATRLAALFNPTEPAVEQEWVDTENAARTVGLAPMRIEVRAPDEIERAFALLQKEGITILVVFTRVFSLTHRNRIIDLARVHKIAAVYGSGGFARAGGLAGLGAYYPDLLRRSAILVDRILKGAKPADLPVEQPTKFELVINLKTARALGLTIPPSVLLRADQVIE